MPSAMNANRTVQSASPDVGSAPGSMGNFALGGQAEVLKQVLCVLDKKVRNLEKKKVSLFESNLIRILSDNYIPRCLLCTL